MNNKSIVLTEKGQLTRNRILKISEKLFAEKGYDGTSVDEIAGKAGINKSTLYHYFNSKENILKDTIEIEILKYRKDRAKKIEIKNLFNSNGSLNDESIEFIIECGISFMRKYENIFRIILTESLKTKNQDDIVFEIFNKNLMGLFNELESSNIKIRNKNEIITRLFFFEIMPMIIFVTMNNSFSQYYKISSNELKEYFKTTYRIVYKEIWSNIEFK